VEVNAILMEFIVNVFFDIYKNIGDFRVPVLVPPSNIDLPKFAFENPVTLAYWTYMRVVTDSSQLNILQDSDGSVLWDMNYVSTGPSHFSVKCDGDEHTAPNSPQINQWVHHTIVINYPTSSTADIKYAINGGAIVPGVGKTCTQIADSTDVFVRMFTSNAYFRDLKMFSFMRSQDEITFGYRNKETPNGEFIFYYDLVDLPGSAILKDSTLRTNGNYKVPAEQKHDNTFVYVPLETIPIICSTGKVYDVTSQLCVLQKRAPLYYDNIGFVSDITGPIKNNMVTFWFRLDSTGSSTDLLTIDYQSPTRRWYIYYDGSYVRASIATSSGSSVSGSGSGSVTSKMWAFIAAYVNTGSSPGCYFYSMLVVYTSSNTGSSSYDSGTLTSTGANVKYGVSCSSCPFSMMDLKIYKSLPTTNANDIMFRKDTPFTNPNVILYYYDFSNTLVGHYYKTTYVSFGTQNLPNAANAVAEAFYNPFYVQFPCPLGTMSDSVACVPNFGHLSMSYPTSQFQTIPIFGKLSNTDYWTLEAWTISGTVTDSGIFNIIGLGDEECAFMAVYRTNPTPVLYALKQKLSSTVTIIQASTSIALKEKFWTYITINMGDFSTLENFVVNVEGDTNYAYAKLTTTWGLSYTTNKLNYIMVGGALGESVATIHPNLKVKNIHLWKGSIQYSKLVYMHQRGYDYSWKIPELLDRYDFANDFDSVLEVSHFSRLSHSKIKAVHHYPSLSPNDYYEKQAAYENLILTQFNWLTTSIRMTECAKGYVYRRGKCAKDEGAINAYSPELSIAQVKLSLGNKEISADWTIEMWIKVRSMMGSDIPIMVQETLDTNGIAIKRNANNKEILVYAGKTSATIAIRPSCGFMLSSWMHLAIQNSKEGNFVKAFVDPPGTDTDCPTNNFYINTPTRIDSSHDFILGDPAGGFDGKIKEFRLWNTIRTKDFDIPIYKYSALNADNQNQYVLYYPMNEGESTIIHEGLYDSLQGELIYISGTNQREAWTRDYDLPICNPSHAFDLASLSCRFTNRKAISSSSSIYKVYFKPNQNPTDSFTLTFWICPKDSIYEYSFIQSNYAFQFYISNSNKYTCRVTTINPDISTTLVLTSPTAQTNKWSYVSCALNSQIKKVRGNVDQNFYETTISGAYGQPYLKWILTEYISITPNSYLFDIKLLRFYNYYLSKQQISVSKNEWPNLGNPSLLLFSMIDESYTAVYDPSNKIYDLTSSPSFGARYEDRDLFLATNYGGMRATQQIIPNGILLITSKTTAPITIPIGQKGFYLINREGFNIRLQTRIKPPLLGKVTFFENTGVISAYIDSSTWNIKFDMYNFDTQTLETFTTQHVIPPDTWTWLTFMFNPNIPNIITIGIEQNFETFELNFAEGTLLTNVNSLTILANGARETSIREFSVHTVGFSKNEGILNLNRRFDPGRDIMNLLAYYRINEGFGNTLSDIATGYYNTLLWDLESTDTRTVTITTSVTDGPRWASDKDEYRFCKPHQVYINNVCLNNDKSLLFIRSTSRSIILPPVSFTNEYTFEFWLYAKYDLIPSRTEQLFVRNPSRRNKIELITGAGNTATIRCRILEDTSTMKSSDGKDYLEYKNIATSDIRLKWTFISIANSDLTSSLRFNGQISTYSVAKAFPIQTGIFFPMTDSIEINKSGTNGFTGSIRELRIWNYFMPTATSTLLMRTELRPMLYHKTLLAYWKLDESAGTKIYDTSFYSQTANLPVSDVNGNCPEWVEIQTSGQLKPELASPSERLEKFTNPLYTGSVYIDKNLRAYAGTSTTIGPIQIPITYNEAPLTEITVRLWAKIGYITGNFELGRDKAFKIIFTHDPIYPLPIISYYAGETSKQIDTGRNIGVNEWFRIHFAITSSYRNAFINFVSTTGQTSYNIKYHDTVINIGNTADLGIYTKYTDCDVVLRSIEIQKKYIEYGDPAIFAEKFNMIPINDRDIVFYVKPGEFYSGHMYDHSLYGTEIDVTFANPLFIYDEITQFCSNPATTVTVDSAGTEININFKEQILVPNANNKTPEEICNILFIKATMQELGASPQCGITANKIRIFVGENPTFMPNTKITFRQDTLYHENCLFPIAGRSLPVSKNAVELAQDYYFTLTIPPFTVYPFIEFTQEDEQLMCSSLHLNIQNYGGLANRPISQFNIYCINTAGCESINTLLGSLPKNSVTKNIDIPTSYLVADKKYKFQASLTNTFGQTVEKQIEILAKSSASAVVSIGGISNKLRRSDDLIIKATAISTTCNGDVVAQGCQDFEFEMVQTDPITEIVFANSTIKDGCSTYRIPANSLNWDTDYWFIMRAVSSANPGYSGSAKFLVRASRIPPVVYAKGSDQSIGFSQPFTIEGDLLMSYPTDQNEILEFMWECTGIDNYSKCRYISGTEVIFVPSKKATFQGNSFLPDTNLKFCFKAISTLNSKKVYSNPACQMVYVLKNETTIQPEIKTSQKIINAQERLLLSCNAKNPPSDDVLIYSWELITNNLNLTSFNKLTGSNDVFRNQFLDIQQGVIKENEKYTFKCNVVKSKGGDSESTTITLRVNQKPKNGILSIFPAQGTELSSTFIFKASNWIDDDYPLRYSFYYKVGHYDNPSELNENQFTVIMEGTNFDEIMTMLPAGNITNENIMTIKLIVYDQNGASNQAFKEIKVAPLEASQKRDKLKEMLVNTTSSNSAGFAQVLGMIMQHINESTPEWEKLEFYPMLINKCVTNFTVQDEGFGKNLHLKVLDVIDDAVKLPDLATETVLDSLEVILSIMKYEKNVIKSAYPNYDYYENELINFGLPQEYINKISYSTNNIFANLTDPKKIDRGEYTYDLSSKISGLISDIGVSLLKKEFNSNNTHKISVPLFNISGVRVNQLQTKDLDIYASSNTKIKLSSDGLLFKNMSNSAYSTYDILVYEIDNRIYPKNNQTLRSHIARILVYNSTEQRPSKNESIYPTKVIDCSPISLKFGNIKLEAPKAIPACTYYLNSYQKYISKDSGVITKKYNRNTKEVECALTHLTDFAILEIGQIQSYINYVILSIVIGLGIILHIIAYLSTKFTKYEFISGQNTDAKPTQLSHVPIMHTEKIVPSELIRKSGYLVIADQKTHKPFDKQNCISLFWYCYICTHYIWKILVVHSKVYSKQAFALMFNVRYTLLMAIISMLYRYDVINAHDVYEIIPYTIMLVPIVAIICSILKFMLRNNDPQIHLVTENSIHPNAEPITYYEHDCFSIKLAISYGLTFGIFVGCITAIILNELVMPYKISYKIANLFVIATTFDVIVFQFFIGFFQLVFHYVVFRKNQFKWLRIFTKIEIGEMLGIIEPEIIQNNQY